ncbi:Conserved_hypothetical protein [Hexamita inflata]|uniref:Uncharacterized protein n=1 Tax=Hexamita inflata TaxID=28002 RepID=A0AA86TFA7_9EUKA|nr:Conserved hypothetical protein [Hexamita inflata]
MNDIKLEYQSLLASSDYGIERLDQILLNMKQVMTDFLNPDMTQIQVDIHPLLDLFASAQYLPSINRVSANLMSLLPLTLMQLQRTVPNVVAPFLRQISRQLILQQPDIYTHCITLIKPDLMCLQNYLRIVARSTDEDEHGTQIELLKHICEQNDIDFQQMLMDTILQTDEELSLAAFEIFFLYFEYVPEQPLAQSDRFFQIIVKYLNGSARECDVSVNLIDMIDFSSNPFNTVETAQIFTSSVARAFKHDKLADDTFMFLLDVLASMFSFNTDLELPVNVQTALRILQKSTIETKPVLTEFLQNNLITVFVKELEIKSYSKDLFKQEQFTVEETDEFFTVQQTKNKLDTKLSKKVFDFTQKVLNALSYDQQKNCFELVKQLSGGQIDQTFVYQKLTRYITFERKFDENLQVLELAKSFVNDLNINSLNTMLNKEDYNTFIQRLDEVAVCFLIVNMFIFINILPPPAFLNEIFTHQIPLDILITLVDNLVFAFHPLQYVAINETLETKQKRELCQVLLQNFHTHLCEQAEIYHELVNQPKQFGEFCHRIIFMQDFLEQISNANNVKIQFLGMDGQFVKRCIQIICDQSLQEVHFPACKCLRFVEFNENILEILLPIVRYIQSAIGEYLEVLVQIFIKIAVQFQDQVIQELIKLSMIKEQRMSLVKFCFQILVQLKHKEVNKQPQLPHIVKFLTQFLFTAFYDEDEQVMTTCFNQLRTYSHCDVGNIINNTVSILHLIDAQPCLSVINSIEQHILQNGQILLSFVDPEVINKYWAIVQNSNTQVTENSFIAINQSFLFSVIIKIVFSGEILITQKDEQEVDEYFTEYKINDFSKIIDALSIVSESEQEIFAVATKYNTFTCQLAFLASMKILTNPITQKVLQPAYKKLIQLTATIACQFLGLSISKFSMNQLQTLPSVLQNNLQRLMEINEQNNFTICDTMYALDRLMPHLAVELDDFQILDLFDLSVKLMNIPDCKYDLRAKCVTTIHLLVAHTRNCIIVLYGEHEKQKYFWLRFSAMRTTLSFLKPAQQLTQENAMVRLLEVLSLGCLYQMEKKLKNFQYIANGPQQAKTFEEIVNFDNLKDDNMDKQKVLIRSKLLEKNKKLSVCINQLIHIFGHDRQQTKDQAENELEESDLVVDQRTQLELAMEQLEQFDALKKLDYQQQLDCIASALTFTSFTYLINSDINCFSNYLVQIQNLFEQKVNILNFVHFTDYLQNLITITQNIIPNLALQAHDCLIFAKITTFLCVVYDKIVFEHITQQQSESDALRHQCQLNIAKFISFFIPVLESEHNQFLELAGYNYLIAFPFTESQVENLTDVFGVQNVIQMLKTSIEAELIKFQKEPTIYRFILNQKQFDLKKIQEDGKLQQCYKLSGDALMKVGSKFYGIFGDSFVQLVVQFLDQPLFTNEITPYQISLAQFIQKLGHSLDVYSSVLLCQLTKQVLNQTQITQIYQFVTEKVTEFEDTDVISEDFLMRVKCLLQIAQNLAGNELADQLILKVLQFSIDLLDPEYRFENDDILLIERYYGMFLLFVRHIMRDCKKIYCACQVELGNQLFKLKKIVEFEPRFSVQIIKGLKEVEEGDIDEQRDIVVWV